jgi:hypothetical protein
MSALKVVRELELTVSRTEKQKVEITFPIYSEHWMEGCTVYSRTDADFRKYSIWILAQFPAKGAARSRYRLPHRK